MYNYAKGIEPFREKITIFTFMYLYVKASFTFGKNFKAFLLKCHCNEKTLFDETKI